MYLVQLFKESNLKNKLSESLKLYFSIVVMCSIYHLKIKFEDLAPLLKHHLSKGFEENYAQQLITLADPRASSQERRQNNYFFNALGIYP